MTQYIKKLPAVFQTVTEKKFFDATFDQVFSKKDSTLLAGYLGRRDPGSYNPITDFYLPEPSKNRTWWQLESTAYARNADTTKTNIFFYEDLLERIEYYGGNTLNQDRLFESEYYSFGPPIDYDMFINYQNYYWIEQGLPPITITGVMGSDIIGQVSYTTPPSATPPNFTLSTGMSIILTDDPLYTDSHVVENLGGCDGIILVPTFPDFTAGTIFEFLPWDGQIELSNGRIISNLFWDGTTWETQAQPGNGDYITIERGSLDRNAWSRTNKWFHIDTINATIAATSSAFPSNATRALRPIIQFIADLTLYKSGTQFRQEITYGFRDNQFGQPLLLTDFQNQQASTLNSQYGISLTDGDLVGFFNDTTPFVVDFFPWDVAAWDSSPYDAGDTHVINEYLYTVNIMPDGSVFLYPYTSYTTPILEGDIVFVDEDGPYNAAQRGQTWYYSNGVWQEAFNDKITTNQAPLFQLYDHNDIPLDDSATYPGSSFEGSKIFSYKINSEPGATVDPVLKFPIVYTSLGQASDIVFDNDLITERYNYGDALLPINGYYYYKTTTNPILYNNWNLYDICDCDDIVPPPPCNCIEVSKQRVIDKFVVGYGSEFKFKLSVTPYGYPASPDIIVSVNGTEVKALADQVYGYTFTVINNSIYVDLTTYLTNLLVVTPAQPPVVEAQTYTYDLLDPEAAGYFEIPQQLEANPTQLEVGEISGSDLIQQFSSIISNQIGFTGSSFGGPNNYRDSRKNRSVGGFILQNLAPALKSMLVSSSDDLDFVAGIRFSSDEYTKFKSKFLTIALQLINQGFSPVAYHNNTIAIDAWVGQILKTVNISKEFSNAFAYSYMVASGTPTFTETITSPGNSTVTLSNYVDLNDPKNVLYIYDVTVPGTETLLLVGRDYEVVSTNLSIDVQLSMGIAPKTLVYYLYQDPLPTYIPSTPSKLGMFGAYEPRIELDATYAVPTNVIIGHDGSKTIAYNDYRDQLLLGLETRIYNGIQARFRNEYQLPLRVESVKTGAFRETRYARDEYLTITESFLNKWSAKYRANYRVNDWPTQSLTTPVNELWKLYNYRFAVTPTGMATDLPGNWKGIFQYFYDTYYPDTRPWEMLGFSQKPVWWETEYGAPLTNLAGQEVWGSAATGLHTMYADLEAGIIRQGPTAVYDPITLLPVPNPMWERPGLSAVIPVDAAGEIIPIITLFNLAYTGNPYEPYDHFDEDWIYGDGSPVEQAWMSTSAYAFSVQEFLYLMRPAPFGELLFDTFGTELSPGMLTIAGIESPVQSSKNWQYVQNDQYSNADPFFAWFRPKNKDQVVHAEIVDGVTEIRFGYQVWISDRILFLSKNVGDTFGQKVRTLDVNLANKLAGFTNKDTTNTYISSITPGASTNTLIIPSTNFDVFLHKSPPIDTYNYSGMIIRALADGTFVVYGYDLLNAEFITLDRSTDKLIEVSVGGTPAEFLYFTVGATYNRGDIVRYNGVYYESIATQTVSTFNPLAFTKLRNLPTVGGVAVTYKPISLATITKFPYGSILKTPQEVFDLMIGYGAWLETQGWKFEEVDPATNQVSNWLASAKQYLFWLNTNWAPDASIQLSPLANTATLVVKRGYPDDVETLTNGIYSILDKNGVAIAPQNTATDRDGPLISVSPTNLAVGGIYFLQVNASETEHILIFDNVTNFNDVVYSPLLRARQQRLRFNGFRSNGWYGKMEAPGYLIIDNQLVPNFDSIVEAMRYYYDPNVTIDNPSLEDLGRHLIGYESKSYLDNLQVSNDVQYLFYQGAIRQKGTEQAFDKLFRSTKVQSNEIIQVFEEWALRVGKFGNLVEQVSTEFKLVPEQNTGEVIVARLNFVPSPIGTVRQINILNAENTYIKIPKVVIAPPDASLFDPNLTGPLRQAKAYIVLDSDNRISRVDVTDPGYGYLSAPYVEIDSGTEPHELDKLYSVWQGAIIKDTTLDNVVNIDIDQTDVWTVRPADPSYSLEFPLTNVIEYPIPNAGYANFNDVDFSSFGVVETTVNWGSSTSFNPTTGDTIWVANNFVEDWSVYKLVDIPFVDVIENPAGTLQLRTLAANPIYPQFSTAGNINNTNSFGNIICMQVVEAHAIVSSIGVGGVITGITVTKSGAGYDFPPTFTIGDGTGADLTIYVSGGEVAEFQINSGGTGYLVGSVITMSPPSIIDPAANYALGFQFNSVDSLASPYNYYDIVTLNGDPVAATDAPQYENFTNVMLFKDMRFLSTPVSVPSYVATGDKIWVDNNGSNLWTVFTVAPVLTAFRVQEPLINTSLFESATVFAGTGNQLVLLPVYDPFKNILPGPARQNLSYLSLQDPARYNVTGDARLFSPNIIFGEQQVGKLWWDLSTTRFVYYEQPIALDGSESEIDNLVYRRDRWAQVFPGSVIQIYEWVKSPVPPADYTGSGIPRDTTSYVQITTSNRFTSATEVNYYFWVLGSTDKPNIENRTLAAMDVSRLLQSPKSQGFAFFSPIQQSTTNNSYMFYNVQEILAYQGDNIQLQYRLAERDDQKHAQWSFFREGDPNSLVTDQFWNKMVDSLCGYTKVLPVSDEFDNAIIVADDLPWDIYGWDISPWDNATSTSTPTYGEILPVPDPTLSESEKYGIEYRPRQGMFVKLMTARKIFVQSANALLKHIPIRDSNPSWNADVATDIYWKYTTWYEIGYENVIPTIVYDTLANANTAMITGQLQVGTILQVTNGTVDGRYELYAVIQLNPNVPTLSLELVGIQDSAIELLDTIYTTTNKYGLSVELRSLLNAFRTQVFVDSNVVDQNELFFSMMNYVVSEQKNPDWLFKTSYIYIKENNLPLSQDQLYIPDQIGNVIDYIMDAKPYHTQIRDYTSTYVTSDIAVGTASDTYKWNLKVQFGPDFAGNQYTTASNIVDPMIGWDFHQGSESNPFDTFNWDATSMSLVINQFISRNNILAPNDPGPGNPWPDTYQISLTFFDASKVGYSQLAPYTFNFDSLNLDNPQTFMSPANVVAIQVGTETLLQGQDYYVEDNGDGTYTAYFFAPPATTPLAFIWIDGGELEFFSNYVPNSETANVVVNPDMTVNVDTKLPVNDAAGPLTPYTGYGDYFDAVPDPLATILVDAGAQAEIPWDQPLNPNPPLLDNTISFKQNVNPDDGETFYRNAEVWSGILTTDLLAPDASTYNTQEFTVFVDPATHPAGTDILSEPDVNPGVVWINGERIEYREKELVAPDTWTLKLLRRGTMGTGITEHLALIPSLADPLVLVPNPVFVEAHNHMPLTSNVDMWSALNGLPDPSSQFAPNEYSNVLAVAAGGIWYSQTAEALFLIDEQGKAIP